MPASRLSASLRFFHCVSRRARLRKGVWLAGLALAGFAWGLAACSLEAPVMVPAGSMPTAETQAAASPSPLPPPASSTAFAAEPAAPSSTPLARAPLQATPSSPSPAAASPAVTTTSQPTPTAQPANPSLLGFSTGGRPIEVYRFGSGPRRLTLIGGIHGGYEWNTIVLAYQVIDYFTDHPEAVPDGVLLEIIPSANPDGQALVTGTAGRFTEKEVSPEPFDGRFNQNQVDLNRNWDCEWKPTAFWRQKVVSAGEKPFSEIETQLLRDFLTQTPLEAAVFWHSAAGAVFPGGCGERSARSDELAVLYAQTAGYAYLPDFDSYDVSGDATNWLAQQGIASFSVELTNHEDAEWEQNLKGVLALMEYIAAQEAEK